MSDKKTEIDEDGLKVEKKQEEKNRYEKELRGLKDLEQRALILEQLREQEKRIESLEDKLMKVLKRNSKQSSAEVTITTSESRQDLNSLGNKIVRHFGRNKGLTRKEYENLVVETIPEMLYKHPDTNRKKMKKVTKQLNTWISKTDFPYDVKFQFTSGSPGYSSNSGTDPCRIYIEGPDATSDGYDK